MASILSAERGGKWPASLAMGEGMAILAVSFNEETRANTMESGAPMRSVSTAVATLAALSLLVSCGIDFQTRAVEKARAYALDNLKNLSETQRDFIRYTDPAIMDRTVYRLRGSNDMMHTCMVWNVPGVEGSVVVAGHGERSLLEWSPDRIVVEDLTPVDKAMNAAAQRAVEFAMTRMLHLSDYERNCVRFNPPEAYRSSFEVEPEEPKDEGKPLSRWEAYLKSKEKKGKPVQYTFVWKAGDDATRIAVCGFSPKEGLTGWKAVEGMKIKVSELDASKASGGLTALPRSPEAEKDAERGEKNAAP